MPPISSMPFSSMGSGAKVIPVRLQSVSIEQAVAPAEVAYRPIFPTAEKSLSRSLRTAVRGAMIIDQCASGRELRWLRRKYVGGLNGIL
jgi:hypothetical protein